MRRTSVFSRIRPHDKLRIVQALQAEDDVVEMIGDVRYYGLTPEQRAAYDYAKDLLLLALDDDKIDSYAIFRLFGALQQIVSGFWHYRPRRRGAEWQMNRYPHHRLTILHSIIAGIPEAAKVIIWCKYQLSLADIAVGLAEVHGPQSVAQYHGALTERERAAELARWRLPAGARFLVATQSTGGHGLTLNEAHYVVFYENGFKYSERAQAEDRNHRIGQTVPVTYVDIVAAGTIDERIRRALAAKADVLEAFRWQVHQVRTLSKAEARGSLQKLAADL